MTLQLILFLASLVVLAVWGYIADKQNKEQRGQEAFRAQLARFKDVYRLMPELIQAMWKDLSNPQTKLAREFFIVSRKIAFDGGGGALIYYTEDHPDLEAKVGILADNGYITDVTHYNVKKHRMSEEFVTLILQAAKE
jgi:hypothetical protein